MAKKDKMEVLFWSIALPGFGQILNNQYTKGFVLIILEILINVLGRINMAIVYSFQGQIEQAILETDYQWIMFYPCVYMFGIWDAYRDAGGRDTSLSFLPFVFSAYIGTIGVIYSSTFTIFGQLIGPIWLPIISLFVGSGIGILIRKIIVHYKGLES